MKTVLDKLLFEYVGIMDIEYLGKRSAKIELVGSHKYYQLARKLFCGVMYNGYKFKFMQDWQCNGVKTSFTLDLFPESKPFYD